MEQKPTDEKVSKGSKPVSRLYHPDRARVYRDCGMSCQVRGVPLNIRCDISRRLYQHLHMAFPARLDRSRPVLFRAASRRVIIVAGPVFPS